jgi:hypothetical protein
MTKNLNPTDTVSSDGNGKRVRPPEHVPVALEKAKDTHCV